MSNHQIFISYSSKDVEAVESFRDKLEQHELRCWMAPRDILPGAAYASSIIDAIEGASLFVIFITANSNASVQVQKEVDRAVHAKLKILTVMLEKVELSKALNYYLCDGHWIDAVHRSKEATAQLIDACQQHLQNDDVPPPPPTAPELISAARWQRRVLLPLALAAVMASLSGASLYLLPSWPMTLGQKIQALWKKSVPDKFVVTPLPKEALGSWSERIGPRAAYFREVNKRWLAPAFPYLLDREDLKSRSTGELMELRDELRARHGFVFDDPVRQRYFESKDWYRPVHSGRPLEETNMDIMDAMPVLDMDNDDLIKSILDERMIQELTSSGQRFDAVQVLLLPRVHEQYPAATLPLTLSELEHMGYSIADEVKTQLLLEKGMPAELLPKSPMELPMGAAQEWYKKVQAPFVIYLQFIELEQVREGLYIQHASDAQSKESAVMLAKTIQEMLDEYRQSAQEAEGIEVYNWKIIVEENLALDHNPQGRTLAIVPNPPAEMRDIQQLAMLAKFMDDAIVEMLMLLHKQADDHPTDHKI